MRDFLICESRLAAVNHVADLVEGALRQQIASTGSANLLVSGGNTPGPVFDRLSGTELPWDKVTVGLVDERWVDIEDPRSNAGLVMRRLLQNNATSARFVPMKSDHASPFEGVDAIDATYAPLMSSPIVLLGMGGDGHLASWFPESKGLDAAMDRDAPTWVSGIDATGAPVAGDMPHRMTLTARALDAAGLTVLHIVGEDKRAVLEHKAAALPIHAAERLLGSRLKEVWAS